jgi:hypothetical protein
MTRPGARAGRPGLLLLLLLGSVTACVPGQSAPAADPAAVLRDAGTALAAVKTAAVELKFGPGATFFGLTVVSASGKVRLPADSQVSIKARQSSDSLIEVQVVTLEGHTYVTVPFLGVQEATGGQAAAVPSVGRIFDATTGLPGILAKGRGAHLDGSSTVDGVDCWHVKARYTAAQVSAAVQPLSPTGDIDADLHIGKRDHLLRKALLSGQLFSAEKKTTLEVRLHDFDAPVLINKPGA